MINLRAAIRNPFRYSKFENLYDREWKVSKNKTLEIQITKYAFNLIEISLDMSWTGQSHAGPSFECGIFGYTFRIGLHDTRHWDREKHTWKTHDHINS